MSFSLALVSAEKTDMDAELSKTMAIRWVLFDFRNLGWTSSQVMRMTVSSWSQRGMEFIKRSNFLPLADSFWVFSRRNRVEEGMTCALVWRK